MQSRNSIPSSNFRGSAHLCVEQRPQEKYTCLHRFSQFCLFSTRGVSSRRLRADRSKVLGLVLNTAKSRRMLYASQTSNHRAQRSGTPYGEGITIAHLWLSCSNILRGTRRAWQAIGEFPAHYDWKHCIAPVK